MKKKAGDIAKEKILNAGVTLWPQVTLQAIADLTGMTHPNILYHFRGQCLRTAIIEHAIKIGESRIIVQALAEKHPAVAKISPAERIRHFNAI